MVNRIAKTAGGRHITPHGLRRTFCTAGLVSGVPMHDMQIAMRHADPRTTGLYDMAKSQEDRHASHRVASFLAGMPARRSNWRVPAAPGRPPAAAATGATSRTRRPPWSHRQPAQRLVVLAGQRRSKSGRLRLAPLVGTSAGGGLVHGLLAPPHAGAVGRGGADPLEDRALGGAREPSRASAPRTGRPGRFPGLPAPRAARPRPGRPSCRQPAPGGPPPAPPGPSGRRR